MDSPDFSNFPRHNKLSNIAGITRRIQWDCQSFFTDHTSTISQAFQKMKLSKRNRFTITTATDLLLGPIPTIGDVLVSGLIQIDAVVVLQYLIHVRPQLLRHLPTTEQIVFCP